MRSVILFPCLLVLGLALTFLLWPSAKPAPESLTLTQSADNQVAGHGEPTPVFPRLVVAEPPAGMFAESVDQFAESAKSDDSADLSKLLLGLADADSAARSAALQAVVQFGSQDALPALRTTLANCADFHEAATLQTAIDFLELPTVAEVVVR